MKTSQTVMTTPLTPHLGVRFEGMDIHAGLNEDDMGQVLDALNHHAIVVLNNQHLTPQDQVAFSKRLGPPLRVSLFTKYKPEGVDELTVVSNIHRDGKPIGVMDAGALWHTDGSYLAKPDMYTVLYALQVPQFNGNPLGDTAFASTKVAYDNLSNDIKSCLEGLRAVNSLTHHMLLRQRANLKAPPVSGKVDDIAPDVEHPIVRTHPITGHKCLFVSEGHTKCIVGLPIAESDSLLSSLYAHITNPEFVYRHKWSVGDVVIWDNCSTQHLAITDYSDAPRLMHRAGISGPVPV